MERSHKEDLDVDGRILKWILGKQDGIIWTRFIWLMMGAIGWLL
jgi:hypothetical protein